MGMGLLGAVKDDPIKLRISAQRQCHEPPGTGGARGHGLDGGGMLQRARHALPRRRDAHIQRQHIVAQRRAALQQHLSCLSHAHAEQVSAHCA